MASRSLAALVGLPKSLGEIYGLLFALPEPVPMGEIMNRLGLSKGSVSQGLKTLRSLGAVRVLYRENERKDLYAAEVELRHLVAGFLQHQLQPQVRLAEEQLARIQQLVDTVPGPDRPFHRQRIGRLLRWQRRIRQMVPLLVSLAGEEPGVQAPAAPGGEDGA